MPYGRLAETTSKKLILSVNTTSYVLSMLYFLAVCKFSPLQLSTLSDAARKTLVPTGFFYEQFNIKMIWLSCLFDIFGGGPTILRTLLYTFIAEETDSASL